MRRTPILYLDTNIYSRIAELSAAEGVRSALQRTGVRMVAHHAVLYECWNTADPRKREAIAKTLVALVSYYRPPPSVLEIEELRNELRFHHPDWIASARRTDQARSQVDEDQRQWQSVVEEPTWRPPGWTEFWRIVSGFHSRDLAAVRKLRSGSGSDGAPSTPGFDVARNLRIEEGLLTREVRDVLAGMDTWEQHCRLAAFMNYEAGIRERRASHMD